MIERTRRQRKARWIYFKNCYRRYPDCAYGQVYCDHVFDSQNPWKWVDFRFPSARHRRRYYAVALVTLEFELYSQADARAAELADIDVPEATTNFWSLTAVARAAGNEVANLSATPGDYWKRWDEAYATYLAKLLQQPARVRPEVKLCPGYGPVAIGLLARVNRQALDPEYLEEFAAWYLSLGEPLTPGIVWAGEEVDIAPAKGE